MDQLAPQRQIVDGAAVIAGVDDRRRLGGEAREVLRHADAAEVVLAQERLQRDRRSELAGADQRAGDLVDAAMNLLDEMLRLEKVGDPVEGVVVDEDGAEQRLFGFEVERRGAIGGFGGVGRGGEPARELFDGRHGFFERFVFLRVGSERDTRLGGRATRIRASIGRRKRCVTDRRAWRARERASGGLSPQYPGEFFFAA